MTEDTELEKTWKEEATTHFKIISWHFPEGLVTAMKNVCQNVSYPRLQLVMHFLNANEVLPLGPPCPVGNKLFLGMFAKL